MKKIVIINGNGSVGKDKFIDFCNEIVGIYNYSSIDTIRTMLRAVGYKGTKTEWDRRFLSDIKKLCVTYNDHPHKETIGVIEAFNKNIIEGAEILFIHIREVDEIDRLKRKFGKDVITLLIKNKNVEKILSNDSDAMVENYHYDVYIENNGTLEDLKESANSFVERLRNGEI